MDSRAKSTSSQTIKSNGKPNFFGNLRQWITQNQNTFKNLHMGHLFVVGIFGIAVVGGLVQQKLVDVFSVSSTVTISINNSPGDVQIIDKTYFDTLPEGTNPNTLTQYGTNGTLVTGCAVDTTCTSQPITLPTSNTTTQYKFIVPMYTATTPVHNFSTWDNCAKAEDNYDLSWNKTTNNGGTATPDGVYETCVFTQEHNNSQNNFTATATYGTQPVGARKIDFFVNQNGNDLSGMKFIDKSYYDTLPAGTDPSTLTQYGTYGGVMTYDTPNLRNIYTKYVPVGTANFQVIAPITTPSGAKLRYNSFYNCTGVRSDLYDSSWNKTTNNGGTATPDGVYETCSIEVQQPWGSFGYIVADYEYSVLRVTVGNNVIVVDGDYYNTLPTGTDPTSLTNFGMFGGKATLGEPYYGYYYQALFAPGSYTARLIMATFSNQDTVFLNWSPNDCRTTEDNYDTSWNKTTNYGGTAAPDGIYETCVYSFSIRDWDNTNVQAYRTDGNHQDIAAKPIATDLDQYALYNNKFYNLDRYELLNPSAGVDPNTMSDSDYGVGGGTADTSDEFLGRYYTHVYANTSTKIIAPLIGTTNSSYSFVQWDGCTTTEDNYDSQWLKTTNHGGSATPDGLNETCVLNWTDGYNHKAIARYSASTLTIKADLYNPIAGYTNNNYMGGVKVIELNNWRTTYGVDAQVNVNNSMTNGYPPLGSGGGSLNNWSGSNVHYQELVTPGTHILAATKYLEYHSYGATFVGWLGCDSTADYFSQIESGTYGLMQGNTNNPLGGETAAPDGINETCIVTTNGEAKSITAQYSINLLFIDYTESYISVIDPNLWQSIYGVGALAYPGDNWSIYNNPIARNPGAEYSNEYQFLEKGTYRVSSSPNNGNVYSNFTSWSGCSSVEDLFNYEVNGNGQYTGRMIPNENFISPGESGTPDGIFETCVFTLNNSSSRKIIKQNNTYFNSSGFVAMSTTLDPNDINSGYINYVPLVVAEDWQNNLGTGAIENPKNVGFRNETNYNQASFERSGVIAVSAPLEAPQDSYNFAGWTGCDSTADYFNYLPGGMMQANQNYPLPGETGTPDGIAETCIITASTSWPLVQALYAPAARPTIQVYTRTQSNSDTNYLNIDQVKFNSQQLGNWWNPNLNTDTCAELDVATNPGVAGLLGGCTNQSDANGWYSTRTAPSSGVYRIHAPYVATNDPAYILTGWTGCDSVEDLVDSNGSYSPDGVSETCLISATDTNSYTIVAEYAPVYGLTVVSSTQNIADSDYNWVLNARIKDINTSTNPYNDPERANDNTQSGRGILGGDTGEVYTPNEPHSYKRYSTTVYSARLVASKTANGRAFQEWVGCDSVEDNFSLSWARTTNYGGTATPDGIYETCVVANAILGTTKNVTAHYTTTDGAPSNAIKIYSNTSNGDNTINYVPIKGNVDATGYNTNSYDPLSNGSDSCYYIANGYGTNLGDIRGCTGYGYYGGIDSNGYYIQGTAYRRPLQNAFVAPLIAPNNPGYTFAGWQGCESIEDNFDANWQLTANFGGTATPDGINETCVVNYNGGSTKIVTALYDQQTGFTVFTSTANSLDADYKEINSVNIWDITHNNYNPTNPLHNLYSSIYNYGDYTINFSSNIVGSNTPSGANTTEPVFYTDVGVVTDTGVTNDYSYTKTFNFNTPSIYWYKFTIPNNLTTAGSEQLQITASTAFNSYRGLAVYNSSGALVTKTYTGYNTSGPTITFGNGGSNLSAGIYYVAQFSRSSSTLQVATPPASFDPNLRNCNAHNYSQGLGLNGWCTDTLTNNGYSYNVITASSTPTRLVAPLTATNDQGYGFQNWTGCDSVEDNFDSAWLKTTNYGGTATPDGLNETCVINESTTAHKNVRAVYGGSRVQVYVSTPLNTDNDYTLPIASIKDITTSTNTNDNPNMIGCSQVVTQSGTAGCANYQSSADGNYYFGSMNASSVTGRFTAALTASNNNRYGFRQWQGCDSVEDNFDSAWAKTTNFGGTAAPDGINETCVKALTSSSLSTIRAVYDTVALKVRTTSTNTTTGNRVYGVQIKDITNSVNTTNDPNLLPSWGGYNNYLGKHGYPTTSYNSDLNDTYYVTNENTATLSVRLVAPLVATQDSGYGFSQWTGCTAIEDNFDANWNKTTNYGGTGAPDGIAETCFITTSSTSSIYPEVEAQYVLGTQVKVYTSTALPTDSQYLTINAVGIKELNSTSNTLQNPLLIQSCASDTSNLGSQGGCTDSQDAGGSYFLSAKANGAYNAKLVAPLTATNDSIYRFAQWIGCDSVQDNFSTSWAKTTNFGGAAAPDGIHETCVITHSNSTLVPEVRAVYTISHSSTSLKVYSNTLYSTDVNYNLIDVAAFNGGVEGNSPYTNPNDNYNYSTTAFCLGSAYYSNGVFGGCTEQIDANGYYYSRTRSSTGMAIQGAIVAASVARNDTTYGFVSWAGCSATEDNYTTAYARTTNFGGTATPDGISETCVVDYNDGAEHVVTARYATTSFKVRSTTLNPADPNANTIDSVRFVSPQAWRNSFGTNANINPNNYGPSAGIFTGYQPNPAGVTITSESNGFTYSQSLPYGAYSIAAAQLAGNDAGYTFTGWSGCASTADYYTYTTGGAMRGNTNFPLGGESATPDGINETCILDWNDNVTHEVVAKYKRTQLSVYTRTELSSDPNYLSIDSVKIRQLGVISSGNQNPNSSGFACINFNEGYEGMNAGCTQTADSINGYKYVRANGSINTKLVAPLTATNDSEYGFTQWQGCDTVEDNFNASWAAGQDGVYETCVFNKSDGNNYTVIALYKRTILRVYSTTNLPGAGDYNTLDNVKIRDYVSSPNNAYSVQDPNAIGISCANGDNTLQSTSYFGTYGGCTKVSDGVNGYYYERNAAIVATQLVAPLRATADTDYTFDGWVGCDTTLDLFATNWTLGTDGIYETCQVSFTDGLSHTVRAQYKKVDTRITVISQTYNPLDSNFSTLDNVKIRDYVSSPNNAYSVQDPNAIGISCANGDSTLQATSYFGAFGGCTKVDNSPNGWSYTRSVLQVNITGRINTQLVAPIFATNDATYSLKEWQGCSSTADYFDATWAKTTNNTGTATPDGVNETCLIDYADGQLHELKVLYSAPTSLTVYTSTKNSIGDANYTQINSVKIMDYDLTDGSNIDPNSESASCGSTSFTTYGPFGGCSSTSSSAGYNYNRLSSSQNATGTINTRLIAPLSATQDTGFKFQYWTGCVSTQDNFNASWAASADGKFETCVINWNDSLNHDVRAVYAQTEINVYSVTANISDPFYTQLDNVRIADFTTYNTSFTGTDPNTLSCAQVDPNLGDCTSISTTYGYMYVSSGTTQNGRLVAPLTATNDPGFTFAGWSGCQTVQDNYDAVWNKTTNNGGTATPDGKFETCQFNFTDNTIHDLKAQYSSASLQVTARTVLNTDPEYTSLENTQFRDIGPGSTIPATFDPNSYSLIGDLGTYGGITDQTSPNGRYYARFNSSIATRIIAPLEAKNDPEYKFVSWTGCDSVENNYDAAWAAGTDSFSETCVINVGSNSYKNIIAQYQKSNTQLTVATRTVLPADTNYSQIDGVKIVSSDIYGSYSSRDPNSFDLGTGFGQYGDMTNISDPQGYRYTKLSPANSALTTELIAARTGANDPGYGFVSWTGCDSVQDNYTATWTAGTDGVAETCIISQNDGQNHTVIAQYQKTTLTVFSSTVNTSDTGYNTIDGVKIVDASYYSTLTTGTDPNSLSVYGDLGNTTSANSFPLGYSYQLNAGAISGSLVAPLLATNDLDYAFDSWIGCDSVQDNYTITWTLGTDGKAETCVFNKNNGLPSEIRARYKYGVSKIEVYSSTTNTSDANYNNIDNVRIVSDTAFDPNLAGTSSYTFGSYGGTTNIATSNTGWYYRTQSIGAIATRLYAPIYATSDPSYKLVSWVGCDSTEDNYTETWSAGQDGINETCIVASNLQTKQVRAQYALATSQLTVLTSTNNPLNPDYNDIDGVKIVGQDVFVSTPFDPNTATSDFGTYGGTTTQPTASTGWYYTKSFPSSGLTTKLVAPLNPTNDPTYIFSSWSGCDTVEDNYTATWTVGSDGKAETCVINQANATSRTVRAQYASNVTVLRVYSRTLLPTDPNYSLIDGVKVVSEDSYVTTTDRDPNLFTDGTGYGQYGDKTTTANANGYFYSKNSFTVNGTNTIATKLFAPLTPTNDPSYIFDSWSGCDTVEDNYNATWLAGTDGKAETCVVAFANGLSNNVYINYKRTTLRVVTSTVSNTNPNYLGVDNVKIIDKSYYETLGVGTDPNATSTQGTIGGITSQNVADGYQYTYSAGSVNGKLVAPLTATNDLSYQFAGWTGCASVEDNYNATWLAGTDTISETCVFNFSNGISNTVRATYQPPTSITVNAAKPSGANNTKVISEDAVTAYGGIFDPGLAGSAGYTYGTYGGTTSYSSTPIYTAITTKLYPQIVIPSTKEAFTSWTGCGPNNNNTVFPHVEDNYKSDWTAGTDGIFETCVIQLNNNQVNTIVANYRSPATLNVDTTKTLPGSAKIVSQDAFTLVGSAYDPSLVGTASYVYGTYGGSTAYTKTDGYIATKLYPELVLATNEGFTNWTGCDSTENNYGPTWGSVGADTIFETCVINLANTTPRNVRAVYKVTTLNVYTSRTEITDPNYRSIDNVKILDKSYYDTLAPGLDPNDVSITSYGALGGITSTADNSENGSTDTNSGHLYTRSYATITGRLIAPIYATNDPTEQFRDWVGCASVEDNYDDSWQPQTTPGLTNPDNTKNETCVLNFANSTVNTIRARYGKTTLKVTTRTTAVADPLYTTIDNVKIIDKSEYDLHIGTDPNTLTVYGALGNTTSTSSSSGYYYTHTDFNVATKLVAPVFATNDTDYRFVRWEGCDSYEDNYDAAWAAQLNPTTVTTNPTLDYETCVVNKSNGYTNDVRALYQNIYTTLSVITTTLSTSDPQRLAIDGVKFVEKSQYDLEPVGTDPNTLSTYGTYGGETATFSSGVGYIYTRVSPAYTGIVTKLIAPIDATNDTITTHPAGGYFFDSWVGCSSVEDNYDQNWLATPINGGTATPDLKSETCVINFNNGLSNQVTAKYKKISGPSTINIYTQTIFSTDQGYDNVGGINIASTGYSGGDPTTALDLGIFGGTTGEIAAPTKGQGYSRTAKPVVTRLHAPLTKEIDANNGYTFRYWESCGANGTTSTSTYPHLEDNYDRNWQPYPPGPYGPSNPDPHDGIYETCAISFDDGIEHDITARYTVSNIRIFSTTLYPDDDNVDDIDNVKIASSDWNGGNAVDPNTLGSGDLGSHGNSTLEEPVTINNFNSPPLPIQYVFNYQSSVNPGHVGRSAWHYNVSTAQQYTRFIAPIIATNDQTYLFMKWAGCAWVEDNYDENWLPQTTSRSTQYPNSYSDLDKFETCVVTREKYFQMIFPLYSQTRFRIFSNTEGDNPGENKINNVKNAYFVSPGYNGGNGGDPLTLSPTQLGAFGGISNTFNNGANNLNWTSQSNRYDYPYEGYSYITQSSSINTKISASLRALNEINDSNDDYTFIEWSGCDSTEDNYDATWQKTTNDGGTADPDGLFETCVYNRADGLIHYIAARYSGNLIKVNVNSSESPNKGYPTTNMDGVKILDIGYSGPVPVINDPNTYAPASLGINGGVTPYSIYNYSGLLQTRLVAAFDASTISSDPKFGFGFSEWYHYYSIHCDSYEDNYDRNWNIGQDGIKETCVLNKNQTGVYNITSLYIKSGIKVHSQTDFSEDALLSGVKIASQGYSGGDPNSASNLGEYGGSTDFRTPPYYNDHYMYAKRISRDVNTKLFAPATTMKGSVIHYFKEWTNCSSVEDTYDSNWNLGTDGVSETCIINHSEGNEKHVTAVFTDRITRLRVHSSRNPNTYDCSASYNNSYPQPYSYWENQFRGCLYADTGYAAIRDIGAGSAVPTPDHNPASYAPAGAPPVYDPNHSTPYGPTHPYYNVNPGWPISPYTDYPALGDYGGITVPSVPNTRRDHYYKQSVGSISGNGSIDTRLVAAWNNLSDPSRFFSGWHGCNAVQDNYDKNMNYGIQDGIFETCVITRTNGQMNYIHAVYQLNTITVGTTTPGDQEYITGSQLIHDPDANDIDNVKILELGYGNSTITTAVDPNSLTDAELGKFGGITYIDSCGNTSVDGWCYHESDGQIYETKLIAPLVATNDPNYYFVEWRNSCERKEDNYDQFWLSGQDGIFETCVIKVDQKGDVRETVTAIYNDARSKVRVQSNIASVPISSSDADFNNRTTSFDVFKLGINAMIRAPASKFVSGTPQNNTTYTLTSWTGCTGGTQDNYGTTEAAAVGQFSTEEAGEQDGVFETCVVAVGDGVLHYVTANYTQLSTLNSWGPSDFDQPTVAALSPGRTVTSSVFRQNGSPLPTGTACKNYLQYIEPYVGPIVEMQNTSLFGGLNTLSQCVTDVPAPTDLPVEGRVRLWSTIEWNGVPYTSTDFTPDTTRYITKEALYTNTLYAYYDASHPQSLTGNNATDLSNRNNTGTVSGPTYSNTGIPSWTFDGINDYINSGLKSNYSTDVTYEIWYKRNADQRGALITSYRNETNSLTRLALTNGGDDAMKTDTLSARDDNRFSEGDFISSDYWQQGTISYDSTDNTISIYANGVLQNVFNYGALYPGSSNAGIDIGKSALGDFFSGQVAVVRLYNSALPEQIIRDNFNAEKEHFGFTEPEIGITNLPALLDFGTHPFSMNPHTGTDIAEDTQFLDRRLNDSAWNATVCSSDFVNATGGAVGPQNLNVAVANDPRLMGSPLYVTYGASGTLDNCSSTNRHSLVNVSQFNGTGEYQVDQNFSLNIPGGTFPGVYNSTIEVTTTSY